MTREEYNEFLEAAKEFSHNLLALDTSFDKIRKLDPKTNELLKYYNKGFRELVKISGILTKRLQSNFWGVGK